MLGFVDVPSFDSSNNSFFNFFKEFGISSSSSSDFLFKLSSSLLTGEYAFSEFGVWTGVGFDTVASTFVFEGCALFSSSAGGSTNIKLCCFMILSSWDIRCSKKSIYSAFFCRFNLAFFNFLSW